MSTMALQSTGYLTSSCSKITSLNTHQSISASWTMPQDPTSSGKGKKEKSTQFQRLPPLQSETSGTPNLHFDRLQQPDEELDQENVIEFGQFVAREAMLDEEYWTAAWLRAESHWEDKPNDRYVDNYKRKFADQEFNALKRRCKAQIGQRCTCIIAVRKEETKTPRTILKSVVGTLDLTIGHLSHGETFPGEKVKAPIFCNIKRRSSNSYGYIANLCVAKCARRQGIARNMLHFAIRSAKENGTEQVFVHVHRENRPAQNLYQKVGFKVVELASLKLSEQQPQLLCLKV